MAPLMTRSQRLTAGAMKVLGSNRLNLRLGPLAVTRMRPASLPVVRRLIETLSPAVKLWG